MTTRALSPEFLLTAACCRWPPSEARDTALRTAASGVTDCNRFLTTVKRHRVLGLVNQALSTAAIPVSSSVAEELATRAKRVVRRNMLLTGEAARLQRLFAAAGIPSLVLKGIAVAQLAYGSLGTKQTMDLDLLVPQQHAEAAWQILEREGFMPASPTKHFTAMQRRALIRYGKDVELARSGLRFRVDLQWRAAYNPTLLRGIDAHSPAQDVAVGDGLNVRTLARDDLFAYLCVHGAQHAWSRLKWLADLNALIAANAADVERLYRHAQRIGAGLCAGQALLLCQWLLALNLPAGLAAELAGDKRVNKLTALALTAMTAPKTEMESARTLAGLIRVVSMQFLLGRGWTFYAAQLRAMAAAPADIVHLPLPPALYFLYPLLRLPLWLWRRATARFPR